MNHKKKFQELEGVIVAKYGTRGLFAKELDMTLTTLGRKLNGKSPWKQKEIELSCKLLEIPKKNIQHYFFN